MYKGDIATARRTNSSFFIWMSTSVNASIKAIGKIHSFEFLRPITAWAVALSCYISHGAMHRKKADFDPSGAKTPEPILMKLGMVDYVHDPTLHANFGGGSYTWVVWAHTWLVKSRSFFSFFLFFFLSFFLFLLSSPRAQVAFLDRSGRSIRQNACFRPRMCLLGVSTISDNLSLIHIWRCRRRG